MFIIIIKLLNSWAH